MCSRTSAAWDEYSVSPAAPPDRNRMWTIIAREHAPTISIAGTQRHAKKPSQILKRSGSRPNKRAAA
jgi:hypothetical protein